MAQGRTGSEAVRVERRNGVRTGCATEADEEQASELKRQMHNDDKKARMDEQGRLRAIKRASVHDDEGAGRGLGMALEKDWGGAWRRTGEGLETDWGVAWGKADDG